MSEADEQAETEQVSEDLDHEEVAETLTLEQRQTELKKSRWNVFLWLGIAVLMFTFALFPMPFDADYDNFTNSAEKDIGFVWGPSLPGEDFLDASIRLDVTATNPPRWSNTSINAFVLQLNDCQQQLAPFTEEAKLGTNHAYQFQSLGDLIEGEEYTFDFSVDIGQYCIIVQYYNETSGEVNGKDSNDLSVDGKVWSSQSIGGLLGILCLSLSGFAFIGAQKHGKHVKSLLENGDESTEEKVLSSISEARIAAGPSGAPPSAPGPTGPPSGPTGPPAATGPSGPPSSAEAPLTSPAVEQAPLEPVIDTAPVTQQDDGSVFEAAEGGYFYKKLADGNYEQTVYVQGPDGTYSPYQG